MATFAHATLWQNVMKELIDGVVPSACRNGCLSGVVGCASCYDRYVLGNIPSCRNGCAADVVGCSRCWDEADEVGRSLVLQDRLLRAGVIVA